jgi:predicted nucleotidyltransferase
MLPRANTLKEVMEMSYEELLQTKREDILRTANKYGAYNVRIFGSVARGEADAQSDIDFLVDMEKDEAYSILEDFSKISKICLVAK